jgi:O-antigen ligase
MRKIISLSLLIPAASGLVLGSILAVRFLEHQNDYAMLVPLIVIGLALWVAFLFRPFTGYLFFLLALPFQSEDYAVLDVSGAVLRPCDLIALPVFLGWLFSACFIKKEGLPFRKSGIELPLFAFAAFVTLSAWWSTSFIGSVSKVLQLIYAIILFYMCKDLIKTKSQLRAVFWAWLGAGCFLALTTIYSALTGSARAASDLSPNSLVTGEILNYPIFLGLGILMVQRALWARTSVFLMVFLCAAALIATGSRGPTLGLAGAAVFLFAVSPEFHKLLRFLPSLAIVAFVVFALGCVTLGVYPIEELRDMLIRFLQVIEDPMSDAGVRFRVTLWEGALDLFSRFPIIGIGVGSLADRMPKYIPLALGHTEVLHCMYLEMLVLFGCLGFLLFGWLFVRMVRSLWWIRRNIRDPILRRLFNSICAALVAQAIGWLTYGKFIEARVFWVCFSLVFSISYLSGNETKGWVEAPTNPPSPGGKRNQAEVGFQKT